MEAINASFASAQQVTLSGLSPATAYMIGYPYRDAGELDTATLIQDPTFNPQDVWLGGPVGSLFGTGLNATAVLFLVNVSCPPSKAPSHCSCKQVLCLGNALPSEQAPCMVSCHIRRCCSAVSFHLNERADS